MTDRAASAPPSGMLRDRVDPESEVQLIELLSILLDKLEDQEARELAEEQN